MTNKDKWFNIQLAGFIIIACSPNTSIKIIGIIMCLIAVIMQLWID
jgi:hypothetical protein